MRNAARIMNLYRLRSLPVINQNTHDIIGQISSKRIIKYIYETFSRKKIDFKKMITASDIMTPDLIIIDPKDKFDSAKATMRRDLIDHLPVAERHSDGKIMIRGMITSNHIMQTLIPVESIGRRSLGTEDDLKSEQEVVGIADKNVTIVNPDDTITSIIDSLFKANSTYTIVKLFYRDITLLLGDQIQSDMPIYIIGMPEDPFEAELVRSKFVNHLSRMSP
ncbi:MAG: CBS domain-containing protein [Nitrososphaeraceae archaeon]